MAHMNSHQLTELATLAGRVSILCADPEVRKSGRQFKRDTATVLRSGSAFFREAGDAWRRSASAPDSARNRAWAAS